MELNQVQRVKIKIERLENKLPGQYIAIFDFMVNGKNYGNSIILNLEIIDLVATFRKEYNLPKEDYTDEKLRQLLLIKNYKFELAFDSLFQ